MQAEKTKGTNIKRSCRKTEKLLSKRKEKGLTEGQGIGLQDQPVICSLICGKDADPFFCGLPRFALLFQLRPQHRTGVGKLLQGVVQLCFSRSLGILELLRVVELSLHELILQLSGDFPLSVQSFLVLLGELLLFSCNPEAKC